MVDNLAKINNTGSKSFAKQKQPNLREIFIFYEKDLHKVVSNSIWTLFAKISKIDWYSFNP